MSTIPKAVLYYHPESIWSSTALLALEEKGYGDDEVDRRVVDLAKGENFAPSFLRLNPKATVPTLVVPLQKTLSEDVESRYRAITEIKAIVEFLDKSRSAMSHTRSTSSAPAPALAPATIAFSSTSTVIIDDILHSKEGDPDTLRYMNARDRSSLRALANLVLPSLIGKQQSLTRYISDADNQQIQISEKVKNFWREKKAATEVLLDVFANAEKADGELDAGEKANRAEYFRTAKVVWEVALRDVLIKLNREIIGPYTLGDQLSLADLHLAAWVTRLLNLAGGTPSEDGTSAIAKLEAHIGTGFVLPKDFQPLDAQRKELNRPAYQSKLSAFWDAVRERPSWKKVYAGGLH